MVYWDLCFGPMFGETTTSHPHLNDPRHRRVGGLEPSASVSAHPETRMKLSITTTLPTIMASITKMKIKGAYKRGELSL